MAKARGAAAWRRGFLAALAKCGNVRLAARQAGVDHSTAYALRQRDAAFGARWRAAVARAAARAEAGAMAAPVPAPARVSKADALAPGADSVAGLVVRRSRNAGTQVVRAGPGRWSVAVERAFLEALARTACVRRAAEVVGLSATAAYARRKRDAGLAARWAEALREGEAQIGDFLTAAVLAAFDPEGAASGVPAASVAEAIAIARLKGLGGKAGRAPARERDLEAMRVRVSAQIAAIKRARDNGAPGTAPDLAAREGAA